MLCLSDFLFYSSGNFKKRRGRPWNPTIVNARNVQFCDKPAVCLVCECMQSSQFPLVHLSSVSGFIRSLQECFAARVWCSLFYIYSFKRKFLIKKKEQRLIFRRFVPKQFVCCFSGCNSGHSYLIWCMHAHTNNFQWLFISPHKLDEGTQRVIVTPIK